MNSLVRKFIYFELNFRPIYVHSAMFAILIIMGKLKITVLRMYVIAVKIVIMLPHIEIIIGCTFSTQACLKYHEYVPYIKVHLLDIHTYSICISLTQLYHIAGIFAR